MIHTGHCLTMKWHEDDGRPLGIKIGANIFNLSAGALHKKLWICSIFLTLYEI